MTNLPFLWQVDWLWNIHIGSRTLSSSSLLALHQTGSPKLMATCFRTSTFLYCYSSYLNSLDRYNCFWIPIQCCCKTIPCILYNSKEIDSQEKILCWYFFSRDVCEYLLSKKHDNKLVAPEILLNLLSIIAKIDIVILHHSKVRLKARVQATFLKINCFTMYNSFICMYKVTTLSLISLLFWPLISF